MWYEFRIYVPIPKSGNSAFNHSKAQAKVIAVVRKMRSWKLVGSTAVISELPGNMIDNKTGYVEVPNA